MRGDKLVEVARRDVDGRLERLGLLRPCRGPGTTRIGWTFANALDYDPVEDAYYLGMRNFSSITKINRATRRL